MEKKPLHLQIMILVCCDQCYSLQEYIGFTREKHFIYMSHASFVFVFVSDENLNLFFYNKDNVIDLNLKNFSAAVFTG